MSKNYISIHPSNYTASHLS